MPEDTPTMRVMQMRQKGLDNNQIIQALQKDGYPLQQIYDAMSQADVKQTIEGNVSQQGQQEPQVQGQNIQTPQLNQQQTQDTDTIQALIESMVEDKWNELLERLGQLGEWKEEVDQKLTSLEHQINGLKEQFDRLHQGVLEKIGGYDQHITEVGTDLKAMEKVFQKVLPGFVENVGELSRITKELRQTNQKIPSGRIIKRKS